MQYYTLCLIDYILNLFLVRAPGISVSFLQQGHCIRNKLTYLFGIFSAIILEFFIQYGYKISVYQFTHYIKKIDASHFSIKNRIYLF